MISKEFLSNQMLFGLIADSFIGIIQSHSRVRESLVATDQPLADSPWAVHPPPGGADVPPKLWYKLRYRKIVSGVGLIKCKGLSMNGVPQKVMYLFFSVSFRMYCLNMFTRWHTPQKWVVL